MSEESEVIEPTNIIVSQESAMLQVIERASINPAVDIDKMERLLQMQITMCDRQAVQAWSTAMVKTQGEIPGITATKKNKGTDSMYADLKGINNVITPIYTRNGFSLSFGQGETTPEALTIPIICEVSHIGGHSKTFNYDSPIVTESISGKKIMTETHARASAVSYGRRYLVLMIFNLTIVGEDDDGNLGDGRTVTSVESWWIEHNIAVRGLFDSIVTIKQAIATEDLDALAESWYELSDDEKGVIWSPAPTKGGILTTKEREALKCDDFAVARTAYYADKK